jgi:hypothetical protein
MSEDGDVIPFRKPPAPPKRDPVLRTNEIEVIGFLRGKDDTDFYINNPVDIAKVFAFIAREKIQIYIGADEE